MPVGPKSLDELELVQLVLEVLVLGYFLLLNDLLQLDTVAVGLVYAE
jgi:hypothetical protein